MPDSGISDGSVYTSAFHDTYVRQQVIAQVTSATRPTGVEGRMIYETDTEKLLVYSGAAWSTIGPVHGALTSWTPTIVQPGSVTVTVTRATYMRIGRLIHCFFSVSCTGTGTASNAIVIGGLPVAAASSAIIAGVGTVFDSSASSSYNAVLIWNGTTSALWMSSTNPAAATSTLLGVTGFTAALASGDTISGNFSYEAAADA